MNNIRLIGRLGKDAELKYTQSGKPVLNFSLCTSKKWRDSQGEEKEDKQWHNVVVWGKPAEWNKDLAKGAEVYVDGEMQYREYESKSGDKVKVAEVNAFMVKKFAKFEQENDGGREQEQPKPGKRVF
jgi:single-strand DNA-binding protein